jgi:glycosyltransferase involved in cell wall biosynthesis
VRNDPATVARLALGLAWLAERQDEVPVYLAHAMGGGADKYLKDRIARDIGCGLSSVVIRVGQAHDWKLELHTALGVTQGLSNDLSLVQALIARLPKLRLIYSCGVGARDAAALPRVLLQMARANGANHPVEVLLHDFFPVSPSYTLLEKDGAYRGVPLAAGPLAQDTAHRYSRQGRPDVSLAEWQAAWGDLIAAAQRCVVFTANSAAILAEAYPLAAQKTFVEPHQILHSIPRIFPMTEDVPVIGVLGNIGYQKGAALLQKLAYELAQTGRARLVVIGHIDPSWALPPSAYVHGCYELRDLPGLVARYGISGWLIPSIWPETFSFTTHEALATGMPVVSFDLGAQGEAVRAANRQGAQATVLPFEPCGGIDIDALLTAIKPD